jgi:hypothetical protein
VWSYKQKETSGACGVQNSSLPMIITTLNLFSLLPRRERCYRSFSLARESPNLCRVRRSVRTESKTTAVRRRTARTSIPPDGSVRRPSAAAIALCDFNYKCLSARALFLFRLIWHASLLPNNALVLRPTNNFPSLKIITNCSAL